MSRCVSIVIAAAGFADPAAAIVRWSRIDADLLRRAPLVPLATTSGLAVTSRRAGGFEHAPGLGPLVDQMWVR